MAKRGYYGLGIQGVCIQGCVVSGFRLHSTLKIVEGFRRFRIQGFRSFKKLNFKEFCANYCYQLLPVRKVKG